MQVFEPCRKLSRVFSKSYVAICFGYRSEAGGIGNERCESFPDVIRNKNLRFQFQQALRCFRILVS
jgi:hypothetical protein